MDIYRETILDHYKNPRNFGTMEGANCSAALHNTSCGDHIRMDVAVTDDGTVTDVRFSGDGCAVSVASASLLTEMVKGKTVDDVVGLTPQVVYDALGTSLTPARVKCALLPLEVLQQAVGTVKKAK
jgi:nitrogen fixation NifU-like protein